MKEDREIEGKKRELVMERNKARTKEKKSPDGLHIPGSLRAEAVEELPNLSTPKIHPPTSGGRIELMLLLKLVLGFERPNRTLKIRPAINIYIYIFANLGKSLSEIHVSLKLLPYLALIKRLFNFSIALTLFFKRLQGRRYSSSPMFKIW